MDVQQRVGSDKLDLDGSVLDLDQKRVDRLDRWERQRASTADVDVRPVSRADGDAFLGVEVAFAERPVIVRAAILEREVLTAEVVDADGERACVDDLYGARRQ